ncbi:3-deoxy-manno-octulosonate cytidylyltransferase [Pelagibacteraceae bacterium]|jgi:3-deoxy-manno-octulosonate cytidylyltransferase (CMP-KDO synthetase)|nr:3-deoxy-manno-octulosonate cytidylyltransferase [Pelagibacteraceae bacterium]
MITQENTAIIIPARLQASRLPNKPLLEIHGKPMIQHVWERAVLSQLGEVLVATDSVDIKNLVEGLGGNACMTSAKHTSGTDRIYEALNKFDLDQRIQFVINLQGDLPTINSEALSTVLSLIEEEGSEMGTLASVFSDKSEIKKNQVVKAFCDYKENENSTLALDFIRKNDNYDENKLYHHIGIYSFRRETLKKFVTLSQTERENNEKLEQLRALDNDIKIKVGLIDFLPLGVDTPEDLEEIKKIIK